MSYDAALEMLRAWESRPVVVEIEPDGTVMRGRLAETDSEGIDGALFTLSRSDRERRDTTGVALALFRDGVLSAERREDSLVIRQGRMTVTVTLEAAPTCGGRRSDPG